MADRSLAGLVRLIDKRIAIAMADAKTMIDLGEASGPSGDAGAVSTCTIDGDDVADVFEPYGLAGQAASSDALLLAPGGDSDSLTALLSSVAGRPATDPGDKALWTAGGHVVYLDDDGDIIIEGKDGGTVTIAGTTGAITVEAASGASIDITVGLGASVNVGGPGALARALGQKVIDGIDAMLAGGVPIAMDGGANLKLTMTTAWNLVKSAILATKAKGI
jgi:hypothetical protein